MRRNAIAGLAVLLIAAAPAAGQSPVTDEYAAQPPQQNNDSSQQPGKAVLGGSIQGGKDHKATKPVRKGGGGTQNEGAGTGPVAVPSAPVAADKGSLPFTGSDLSGLVVLALLLIAGGFVLKAAERATRRRRAQHSQT